MFTPRTRELAVGMLLLFSPAQRYPQLPEPVSNNAVAAIRQDGRLIVLSALGIGPKRTYDAITNSAYVLQNGQWWALPSVPGPGRLAASAVGVGGRFYIFGGYTVASDGLETSLPNVDIYDPTTNRWTRGAGIPVPVDDSVAAVYRDRYVYLISGWSQKDNIRNVQIYDTQMDRWKQATPIPGTPVFGHAGGIAEDAIIYVDGAYKRGGKPKYIASNQCWRGEIDPHNLRQIHWAPVPPHPGKARYRIAAGSDGRMIYFAGGTDNPYNYDGIGYDGRPSQPSATVFAWDEKRRRWLKLENDAHPSMDHRGLVATKSELIVVGGMSVNQQVVLSVKQIPIARRRYARLAPPQIRNARKGYGKSRVSRCW